MCHPVIILLSDILLSRVACASFLKKVSVFFVILLFFILSQSFREQHQGEHKDTPVRVLIIVCRVLFYLFSFAVHSVCFHG